MYNDENDKIISTEYSSEMEQSFIDYSMSVIVSRAIPDIRDGLKPVQRRIIYSMNSMGVSSDKPHRKCARIVGETMGKYHPHGDASIYDALVVMSQDWKKAIPLVDGHGNFGSIEGDAPAASRYTECRLSSPSEQLLLDGLKNNTVLFQDNFDGSETEPVVLPAKIPFALINGSEGIAVGMNTNTPPHNPAEVLNGYIKYIKNNDISLDEMLKTVVGPDFPCGGIIANKDDLYEIYKTGKGKLKVRGKIKLEKSKTKAGKDKLVICEIPYTLIGSGINKLLSDIAELVKNKTLPEITDILNQTSKDGIRLVLELKKDADVERVKSILYNKTKLEDTFGVNMLFISDGRPEQVGLMDVYKEFLKFQKECTRNEFAYKLQKATERLEILKGLSRAIDIIDLIIKIIRGSSTPAIAKVALTGESFDKLKLKSPLTKKEINSLNFSDAQAQAILEIKLIRLIGLEIQSLNKEIEKVKTQIEECNNILSNEQSLNKYLIAQTKSALKLLPSERKTEIVNAKTSSVDINIKNDMDVVVAMDRFSYIKAYEAGYYNKNKELINQESVYITPSKTSNSLLAITCDGSVNKIPVDSIPLLKIKDKGVPVDNISKVCTSTGEVISLMSAEGSKDEEVLLVTKFGYAKRISMEQVLTSRKRVDIITLKEKDSLIGAFYFPGEYLMMLSDKNKVIKFRTDSIPIQKRASAGVLCMNLPKSAYITNALCFDESKIENMEMLDNDKKSIPISTIKLTKRGGKGQAL